MRARNWEAGLETIAQTHGKDRSAADWHSQQLVAAEANFFLQEHVTHRDPHQ